VNDWPSFECFPILHVRFVAILSLRVEIICAACRRPPHLPAFPPRNFFQCAILRPLMRSPPPTTCLFLLPFAFNYLSPSSQPFADDNQQMKAARLFCYGCSTALCISFWSSVSGPPPKNVSALAPLRSTSGHALPPSFRSFLYFLVEQMFLPGCSTSAWFFVV